MEVGYYLRLDHSSLRPTAQMKCRMIACHSNVIQSFKGSVELRTGGVVGVLLLVAAGGGANVCVQYAAGRGCGAFCGSPQVAAVRMRAHTAIAR